MKKIVVLLVVFLLSFTLYSQNGICILTFSNGETAYYDATIDLSHVGDSDNDYIMFASFADRHYTFTFEITSTSESDKFIYYYTAENTTFGISKNPSDTYSYKYIYKVFTTLFGERCELFFLFNL